ncbi:MAG: hypothetical protein AB7N29_20620, partial [Vicinamibacterales bacterium]
MTRRLFIAALAFVAVAVVSAHERFKIVGTIVKVHAAQLDVKAVDGATYEIDMLENTQVMRELEKVPRSELRAGRQVVVEAMGHDMFDLEAV